MPYRAVFHESDDGTRDDIVIDDGGILLGDIVGVCPHECPFIVSECDSNGDACLGEVCHPKESFRLDGGIYREGAGYGVEDTTQYLGEFRFQPLPKLGLGTTAILGYPFQLDDNASIEEIGSLGDEIDTIETYRPPKFEYRVIIVRIESTFGISLTRHGTAERIGIFVREMREIVEDGIV